MRSGGSVIFLNDPTDTLSVIFLNDPISPKFARCHPLFIRRKLMYSVVTVTGRYHARYQIYPEGA
jgi:hypothetical protein